MQLAQWMPPRRFVQYLARMSFISITFLSGSVAIPLVLFVVASFVAQMMMMMWMSRISFEYNFYFLMNTSHGCVVIIYVER